MADRPAPGPHGGTFASGPGRGSGTTGRGTPVHAEDATGSHVTDAAEPDGAGGRDGRRSGAGATGRTETADTARPASLWSRDVALFLAARAVARLGDTMLPVALAAGLLQHGYGAGAVGLAMASAAAAFAGLVVFGGVVADRFSTRTLMIGADLVRLGTQSVAAVLFFSGHVVLWQICAIGFTNGVASAVFQPGVASTVPRLAADVQAANGAIRIAESSAQLAGPAVAGLLVGLVSPGGVFAAHAATYGFSALCLLLLRLPPARPGSSPAEPGTGTFRADLAEGWREFRSRTWLWAVIAVWCLYMVAAWGPTVPLVATEVVRQHGPRAYGLVNSALGAGTVVGGFLALRLRPRRMLRAGALALFAFVCFPATVGAGTGVRAMAAGAAVAGAGQAFWGVMWATSVQTQVPPDVLNRIHAYDVAGSLAMMPVGQALAGPSAALLGTDRTLLVAAAISLVVPAALLSVPAIRGLVRADAPDRPRSGPGGALLEEA
ncbi:MFS transporter [Streptomyces thermodiastaticus]|jgi:MFS family permease|uniref:MFS transporter n=1 Tax=Streptomyces thermodiastaticus TaxID=44061 RepID=UPI0019AA847E|nr:MFS transporter [Streptomyces thermodiastaticus]MCE7552065.1 MFS transporter [Streptomyces thermodiastaticus]GHF78208.1 MFS transporter [Streptomyces thermodiastaticus]